jgi:hypothetical protein
MASAVDLDSLIGGIVGTSDTTTSVKVASGSAATAKSGSGIVC